MRTALTICLILLTITGTANADIFKVCPKILSVTEAKTIYKQSAPLRKAGEGTPIIGFRKEPTLIFNASNFSGSSFTVYDLNGNKLASCPYGSATGHKGRARCTIQTPSLRRSAIAKTGTPAIYFKIKSNTCVGVKDAGRCEGSVKGLCNRLIS